MTTALSLPADVLAKIEAAAHAARAMNKAAKAAKGAAMPKLSYRCYQAGLALAPMEIGSAGNPSIYKTASKLHSAATAGDVLALRAWKLNGTNTYSRALCSYRDGLVEALEAESAKAEAEAAQASVIANEPAPVIVADPEPEPAIPDAVPGDDDEPAEVPAFLKRKKAKKASAMKEAA